MASNLSQAEQAKQKVELRQRARTDKMFLADLLGYHFQPDVHKELFDAFVQFDNQKPYFEQDRVKHRLILWSRAFYKTTATVVEMVQTILNFPNASLMVMQSTVPKGKEILALVKGHFDGSNLHSQLRTLFPEFCADKMGTAMAFTVPARTIARRDPTVFVASPKSSKAGYHPDAGFFDDLVTELNYQNPDQLQKTIVQFSHYTPLINNGGYFYVTGTRYAFGDLYEHIIRNNEPTPEFPLGKWRITIKGCWEVDRNGHRISDSNFQKRKLTTGPKAGETIGISLEELLAIQKDNPETFSAQYLNRPIAAGKEEFTEAMLLGAVIPKDPNITAGPAILFVDLASSTKSTADNSVVLCARQAGRKAVVCDLRSGQWTTLQIAEAILAQALAHRPIKIFIEGTASSTFFIDYLKVIAKDKGMMLNVEPLKVSNNKDAKRLRISAVAGAIKTGRCAFLAGLPGWAALVQQFVEFPKGRHDDEIDTVSLMVQFYSSQTATFDPFPTAHLPFFLRTAGVDYGLEQKITQTDDLAWNPIPEPSF